MAAYPRKNWVPLKGHTWVRVQTYSLSTVNGKRAWLIIVSMARSCWRAFGLTVRVGMDSGKKYLTQIQGRLMSSMCSTRPSARRRRWLSRSSWLRMRVTSISFHKSVDALTTPLMPWVRCVVWLVALVVVVVVLVCVDRWLRGRTGMNGLSSSLSSSFCVG